MDERMMYIVIAVLVALVIVGQIAQMLLARKSVDTSGSQYPPNAMAEFRATLADFQKAALQIAYGVAVKTTIPQDEQGLELYATLNGWKFVKQADGGYLLQPITASGEQKPTTTASASG